MSSGRIRVVHLITDLDVGGAEMMLVRLLAHMDRTRFENHVVSLIPPGALAEELHAQGIPVETLAMRPGSVNPVAVRRLVALLRKLKPSILQTWLYHADLLGAIGGRLARVPAIYWNIRASRLVTQEYSGILRMTRWLAARLSSWPSAVVVNSRAGIQAHERLGYRPRRWVLIPNGIDPAVFSPNPAAGSALRRQLGIAPDACVIGMVARFHPMKGHQAFLEAAGVLGRQFDTVHFVLAGRGVDGTNVTLRSLIAASGVCNCVTLLGERSDVATIMALLDVFVQASTSGEGFPTVVAEAMACGTPCVVTDIGDAVDIVKDTGWVATPPDAGGLLRALQAAIEAGPAERSRRGAAARASIVDRYHVDHVARQYEQLYARS